MSRQLHGVLGVVLLLCSAMLAQSNGNAQKSNADNDTGVTAQMQFGGSTNASGRVFKLDSSLGYNFDDHFGMDIGVPVYFAHSSAGTSTTSNSGIGNPYLETRLTFKSTPVNYQATVTGYFPVADTKKGLSTGRMTADWTNRFEHSGDRLTPFLEAGIGNTIRDSRFFNRPFTSLGFNAHVEAGSTISLSDHVELGGSGYGVLPSGQQRIFSKVVKANTGGTMRHGRVFDTTTETVGTADIARDYGFSTWVGVSPGSAVELEVGFTRSAEYALNTVTFNVGVNLTRALRKQSRH